MIMKIEIRSKNLKINDVAKQKTESYLYNLQNKFPKFINVDSNAHIDISEYDETRGEHVRITLDTQKIGIFRSEAKGEELFKTIDEATKKLESQIKRKSKK